MVRPPKCPTPAHQDQKVAAKEKRFNIVYFGAPAVAAGNAKQINADTILTISLTVFLLVLVVILFFRKTDSIVRDREREKNQISLKVI